MPPAQSPRAARPPRQPSPAWPPTIWLKRTILIAIAAAVAGFVIGVAGGNDFMMQAFGGFLLVPALITLAVTGPVVLWRTYGPRRHEGPPLPIMVPPGPPNSITPGFERAHGVAPRDQQGS
jgi:hypothetical protein